MTPDVEIKEDLLSRLISYFEEAQSASDTARAAAERDRDYYDGRQWTPEEEAQLLARGQAPIVINRIKPKIDFLLGAERKARTVAKCFPVNVPDEHAAEAATQSVRYVLEHNNFDRTRSREFESLLIEGAGFAEIIWNGASGAIDINFIPWDRGFYDPHSRSPDMNDARYRGQVIWMDFDEAKLAYPGKESFLEVAYNFKPSTTETYEDAPRNYWTDAKRRRVRVVEIWHRTGRNVQQVVFCRGGILEGPTMSPYVEDDGTPTDPYVFCSAFVTRDGERYGAIRQLIGIQDEINKRRSKALHLLSVRQVRAEKGAVEDMAHSRRELAKPDGWVETVPGFEFELLPTGDMAAAQFNLLAEAKAEIDAVGANAALTGKGFSDASGRAIQARQQGGQLELGPLFDNLRDWQHRVYRAVWSCVKIWWTEPKFLRVTDNADVMRWVQVNAPLTGRDLMTRKLGAVPPELEGSPALDAVVGMENTLAELDVDIVISDAPDSVTLQQEAFQALVDLARSGVPIPPNAIIEASNIPNKDRVLELMRGTPEERQQREQQQTEDRALQVQKLLVEIAERAARVDKLQAEAGRSAAGAIETETKAVKNLAETGGLLTAPAGASNGYPTPG